MTGVLGALDRPEPGGHKLYNLGNHRTEPVTRLVEVIEQALGKTAVITQAPLQPGDVEVTYADIEASRRDLGYEPTTSIDEGIPRFVDWYLRSDGGRFMPGLA